jgi:hypothetical protein
MGIDTSHGHEHERIGIHTSHGDEHSQTRARAQTFTCMGIHMSHVHDTNIISLSLAAIPAGNIQIAEP